MSLIVSARRRQADDLQALLEGRRASSPAAATELAPLVAVAAALGPDDIRPRDDFRSALRTRLVQEAGVRVPAPRSARATEPERPSARRRARQAVAAVALASVVAGVGAAAASTRALPGDPLYGLKRQVENAQLAMTHGDLGRGRELLEQADTRLGEAESLAAGDTSTTPETRARVSGALTDMQTAVEAATADLTAAYDESGDPEPMELLARFAAEQQQRLDDLMSLLDPALQTQARALSARLAEIDQRVTALLGVPVAGAAPAARERVTGGSGGGGAGGGAGGGSAAGGAAGPAAGTGTGAAAGATSGAGSVVDGVVGTVTGITGGGTSAGSSGPTGASGGGSGSTGGVAVGTGAGTASVPLPTVSAVPLPTSSPVVTDPVAAVTSAVPQPIASALPSVSVCVPVPPLTAC